MKQINKMIIMIILAYNLNFSNEVYFHILQQNLVNTYNLFACWSILTPSNGTAVMS